MGDLKYCFEQKYVPSVLRNIKPHGLAVVDTEGHEKAVREAVSRGVYVYGYLNAGALEKERSYYPLFKHLRLAPYDGWDGEYWVDVTDKAWQQHLIAEAKRMKSLGVIGLYLDNTDIYYMVKEGFRNSMKVVPSPQSVYNALSSVIRKINALGMIVMPNGGDAGKTSITMRNIYEDGLVDGYNRVNIINCIGISTLGYATGASVTQMNWRALVRCSNIDTNDFATGGYLQ